MNQKPNFTFIDLFAGIGGFRIAFESVGGECVFASEWDNLAAKTYEANFGHRPHGDITKISAETIPNHDILTGGFPCQPFSIAGVTKHNALGNAHGFSHLTQGNLFFDVARIIAEKRPRAFLLENVKNLLNHDKKRTFEVIRRTLEDELEYYIYPVLLNAKKLVPQNRERIYIIGFKEPIHFKLPPLPDLQPKFRDILEPDVNTKYTLTDHLWSYLKNYAEKHRKKGNGFGYGLTNLDGVSRTLSARYHKDGSEILIPQGEGINPRRLTPRECARLMGFPDSFQIVCSDSRSYQQFGNSVVVKVVEHIAKEMVSCLFNKEKQQQKAIRQPRQIPLIPLQF